MNQPKSFRDGLASQNARRNAPRTEGHSTRRNFPVQFEGIVYTKKQGDPSAYYLDTIALVDVPDLQITKGDRLKVNFRAREAAERHAYLNEKLLDAGKLVEGGVIELNGAYRLAESGDIQTYRIRNLLRWNDPSVGYILEGFISTNQVEVRETPVKMPDGKLARSNRHNWEVHMVKEAADLLGGHENPFLRGAQRQRAAGYEDIAAYFEAVAPRWDEAQLPSERLALLVSEYYPQLPEAQLYLQSMNYQLRVIAPPGVDDDGSEMTLQDRTIVYKMPGVGYPKLDPETKVRSHALDFGALYSDLEAKANDPAAFELSESAAEWVQKLYGALYWLDRPQEAFGVDDLSGMMIEVIPTGVISSGGFVRSAAATVAGVEIAEKKLRKLPVSAEELQIMTGDDEKVAKLNLDVAKWRPQLGVAKSGLPVRKKYPVILEGGVIGMPSKDKKTKQPTGNTFISAGWQTQHELRGEVNWEHAVAYTVSNLPTQAALDHPEIGPQIAQWAKDYASNFNPENPDGWVAKKIDAADAEPDVGSQEPVPDTNDDDGYDPENADNPEAGMAP